MHIAHCCITHESTVFHQVSTPLQPDPSLRLQAESSLCHPSSSLRLSSPPLQASPPRSLLSTAVGGPAAHLPKCRLCMAEHGFRQAFSALQPSPRFAPPSLTARRSRLWRARAWCGSAPHTWRTPSHGRQRVRTNVIFTRLCIYFMSDTPCQRRRGVTMAGRPPIEAHEDVCRARREHRLRAVLRGGLYGPRGLVLEG